MIRTRLQNNASIFFLQGSNRTLKRLLATAASSSSSSRQDHLKDRAPFSTCSNLLARKCQTPHHQRPPEGNNLGVLTKQPLLQQQQQQRQYATASNKSSFAAQQLHFFSTSITTGVKLRGFVPLTSSLRLIPTKAITRFYSERSKLRTASFNQALIHQAFLNCLDELLQMIQVISLNQLKLDGEQLKQRVIDMKKVWDTFQAVFHVYSKLEDQGWAPGIGEHVPSIPTSYRFEHAREGQELHKISRMLDSLTHMKFRIASHKADPKLHDLYEEITKLQDELKRHFSSEENDVTSQFPHAKAENPSQLEAAANEVQDELRPLVKLDPESHSIEVENDEKFPITDRHSELVHRFSYQWNSLELCEAMVRQILRLEFDHAKNAISTLDRIVPREVWNQLRRRMPELAKYIDHIREVEPVDESSKTPHHHHHHYPWDDFRVD